MNKEYKELARLAQKTRLRAFAPFSRFRVGSALLAANHKIFTGCNIENSSYGLTICAERVAIFKAISEGANKFKAIAIASDAIGFTPPCGACRQVLLDLAGDIDVILVDSNSRIKKIKLRSLLPSAFTIKHLKQHSKVLK
jgi:cytidine deaminase